MSHRLTAANLTWAWKAAVIDPARGFRPPTPCLPRGVTLAGPRGKSCVGTGRSKEVTASGGGRLVGAILKR
jgi:hypothetical protein